jgi:hypothetical protein
LCSKGDRTIHHCKTAKVAPIKSEIDWQAKTDAEVCFFLVWQKGDRTQNIFSFSNFQHIRDRRLLM